MTLRKTWGRLLGYLLTIAMVCGLLLSNGISVKAAVSIGNNGYPYGTNMSSSEITLICEATGAQQCQWQVSDAVDGTYTDINGATEATYTFAPENKKWYRCVVDGTPSKAVQAVKPGDGRTWTGPYSSWYLSNGKVAYCVNEAEAIFDVVGAYQKNNTTYMLQTSFGNCWKMYGGDGTSGTGSTAAPQKIQFSFDDVAVNVSVELGSENGNFAFGCDTQLGDGSTSGDYSDRAALVAALNGDKTLKHIAMVGAAAVNEETDPNAPAFVIEPQGNPMFWIGHYRSRSVYDYNVADGYTKSEVKKNDGSTGSVVTSVESTDSGMTMSWKGVSSVQFAFKVGTAKDTGAVSGNVNYLADRIDGLDPSTSYVVEVKDESGATVATYNISSDANGAIPFEGTDVNGTAFDLTGKSLSITKEGSTDTPANLDIAARPTPDDAEQITDENYVKPEDVAENEVLTTENSITIHPETESKAKQNYKIFNADGTEIAGQDWVAVDANGDVVFSGLSEHTEYLIKAFVPATQTAPRSYISEGVKITTMGTIEVTNPTELSFVQDGLEHEFQITTTPTDANKVYSLSPEENYTEEIVKLKDPGTYTVYYKASKDNYRTVYGSFDVEIREPAPTDIVAVAKDYNGVYDGNAHGIEIEVVVPQTGAVVSYGTKEGEYTLTASPSYTDVGTYKVFYRVTAEGRDEKTGSADIIIEKADSTVTTAPAAKTLTYDGQAQELVTAGTATGGEMQYALGTDATTAPANDLYTTAIPTGTDEGIYYVWYKVVGDSNHLDSVAGCVAVTIDSEDSSDSSDSTQFTAAKTGDPNNVRVWYLLHIASLVGLGFLGFSKKKKVND